jgi:transcriptional regulator with XRE-family HTH domain
MSILSIVGINIQRLRRERRLSQEDLALRSGRTRAYVSGLEAGTRNITLLKLESIAAVLDVEIDELLKRHRNVADRGPDKGDSASPR